MLGIRCIGLPSFKRVACSSIRAGPLCRIRPLSSSSPSPFHSLKHQIKAPLVESLVRNGGRQFSIFSIGKVAGKIVRVPAAVGGSLAAAGTYVAYKVEQASSYTQDQLGKVKDITDGVMDSFSGLWDKVGSIGGGSDGGGSGGGDDGVALGSGTAAAAVGLVSDDDDETLIGDDSEEDEDEEFEEDPTSNDMLNLTRQMIEIRSLLLNVDGSHTLKLPSIVVIGSQSSGKSSVLESIVGQEFLPKGSNMVTRRPIELTLINSPEQASEIAEFPALKMYNLTDFQTVQKVLFDLNMAVPLNEAISNDPIQLTIKSPRVPDLSLVDLPGYIQIEAADQPTELKTKIRELCNRYLENPNIILAISAADVDLANSSALRAAKQADPKGERTIGVITKLDLVTPERAKEILTNKKYPLRMGYVGVITKSPSQTSLFRRKTGIQAYVAQQNYEFSYFKEHKSQFDGTSVGTRLLKKKLMKVLEKSMGESLRPMYLNVQQELEETAYQFKVEFNDRSLTPETYLASCVDILKGSVKEFSERFGRPELRSLLKSELDQRVLDLLAQRYWNRPGSLELTNLDELSASNSQDVYWHRKLDLAYNSLTKLGIGRLSTGLITDSIMSEISNLISGTPLRNHPLMCDVIQECALNVLNSKFYSTADQVENCIKPYKYEIEIEDREWSKSRTHSVQLLKEELRHCDGEFNALKNHIGGRKLNQIIQYLETGDKSKDVESINFSPQLIEHGKHGVFLKNRAALIKMRLTGINSSACKFKENKYKCPEIFMDVVSEKLTTTAVLFLNVELLSDFYYNFPRELDMKLSSLTRDQVEQFAKEDTKVRRHVELQQRKELLELVQNKIEDVLSLQKYKNGK
ncbi:unnamed protein product [Kuraishia capsulata CBS 1993]|uniref:dynamin GTPase n=1 Tax=Kuraishia capsulata CBS 1993 TaxID=1382522 RepID=W6MJS8_9ASCO|nr:uncharacterized protein KUCA_T00002214001 [Kuraishia capsulata CBS 1993]CDK26243.1 unnamed protein product [Kuraishia capsulata CBS 1993]